MDHVFEKCAECAECECVCVFVVETKSLGNGIREKTMIQFRIRIHDNGTTSTPFDANQFHNMVSIQWTTDKRH